ncbi:hypothetical protein EON66_05020 [archaeon]|nr:MAG: hypothetical protein EON66_05020 [archaeon]
MPFPCRTYGTPLAWGDCRRVCSVQVRHSFLPPHAPRSCCRRLAGLKQPACLAVLPPSRTLHTRIPLLEWAPDTGAAVLDPFSFGKQVRDVTDELHLVVTGAAPNVCHFVGGLQHHPRSLADMATDIADTLKSAVSVVVHSFSKRVTDLVPSSLSASLATSFGSWLSRRDKSAPTVYAASTSAASSGAGTPTASTVPPVLPKSMDVAAALLRHDKHFVNALPSPDGAYLLLIERSGRLMLLDAADMVCLHLWKGYRSASVAWLPGSAKWPACFVMLSPKRSALECWSAHGSRLWTCSVPAAAVLRQVQVEADVITRAFVSHPCILLDATWSPPAATADAVTAFQCVGTLAHLACWQVLLT